jgi:hypothetical protein
LEAGKGTGFPKRRAWRATGEDCTFGVLALILVVLVVGLILRRLAAVPAAKENRPSIVLEGPDQLNEAALVVVRTRQANPDEYAQALERAETAVRAAPENGNILNTLGVAQYRMGRYADALPTLTNSEKVNTTKSGSHDADLAFEAMAQHRPGKREEANTILSWLREIRKQPLRTRNADVQDVLRKAKELIEGKPAEKWK